MRSFSIITYFRPKKRMNDVLYLTEIGHLSQSIGYKVDSNICIYIYVNQDLTIK